MAILLYTPFVTLVHAYNVTQITAYDVKSAYDKVSGAGHSNVPGLGYSTRADDCTPATGQEHGAQLLGGRDARQGGYQQRQLGRVLDPHAADCPRLVQLPALQRDYALHILALLGKGSSRVEANLQVPSAARVPRQEWLGTCYRRGSLAPVDDKDAQKLSLH